MEKTWRACSGKVGPALQEPGKERGTGSLSRSACSGQQSPPLPGESEVAPGTEILALEPGGHGVSPRGIQIRRPTVPQPYSLRHTAEGPPGPGALRPLRLPSDLARQGSCGPPRARVCTASGGFRLLEGVGGCATAAAGMSGDPTPGLQARGGAGGGTGGLLRFSVALRESAGTPYGRVSNRASLFQLPPISSPCPPPVLPMILARRPRT